jgi:predicted amidophosphoribosyltransferase
MENSVASYICPGCQNKIFPEDNFCGKCGTPFVQPKAAHDDFSGKTRNDLNPFAIQRRLGEIYLIREKYDKALEIFQELEKIFPDDEDLKWVIMKTRALVRRN